MFIELVMGKEKHSGCKPAHLYRKKCCLVTLSFSWIYGQRRESNFGERSWGNKMRRDVFLKLLPLLVLYFAFFLSLREIPLITATSRDTSGMPKT